ncbi:ArsA family ATPase [bacterium]|nr:ArsA family ATPase [bacterium]
MDSSLFWNKRVFIIIGKGGVGKTTISTMLALAARKRGKRVLLCEINAKEKVASMLGHENVGSVVTEVENGLSIVNITPQEAMREYGLMVLKSKLIYNTLFENRYVKSFLNGLPGLSEMVMLGKIRYHENETNKDGSKKYDLIIVDAPATGHGISFLKFPMTILDVLKKGTLADEERKLLSLLQDKEKTAIHIVSLPEELPVQESKELYNSIKDELNMPVASLFMNSVVSKLFSNEICSIFKDIKDRIPKISPYKEQLDAGCFRIQRQNLNRHYLQLAQKEIPLKSFIIPYIFSNPLDRKDLLFLAELFLENFR